MPYHNKSGKKSKEKFGSGEGGSLTSGLSMKYPCTDSPEQLGMGRKGFSKNQVPSGPDKRKATGPFTFA